MKQLRIMMLAAIVSFYGVTIFTSCSNDDNPETLPDLTQIIQEEPFFNDNKTFRVNKGAATITYICRIGNDFESALDSLIRERELLLTGQPAYSGQGYNIDKEKINVDFSYDSREFILLTFIDKAYIYNVLISDVVIDEKGYFFGYNNPPD
jgi:hypothetical protein